MNPWLVLLALMALALASVCVPIAFTAYGQWRLLVVPAER
jgi:hypothetical protein